jgi:alkaline phosphatase
MTILRAAANMVVNYATTMPGTSQDHTGTEVPVMAQGPQASSVLGVIDEIDLFRIMERALGIYAK